MKKLSIQNFQAHEDLEIEFGQITTIIGPSDAGKSSILRALKWLMRNEPRGTGFIRDGEHTATVSLEIDDHAIVRQRRGESNNLYQMDGDDFKAFGNDVPTNIANALNVSPLNFQGQHDAPFWFTETAGEVSRRLNQIVDLSQIDSTLSNIDGITRKTRTEVEVIKDRRASIKEEGMKLKWTKQADKELAEIETLEKDWKKSKDDLERLLFLLNITKKYQIAVDTGKTCLSAGKEALREGKAWRRASLSSDSLQKSIQLIKKLEIIAKQSQPPSLALLEKSAKKVERLNRQHQILKNLIDRIEGLEAGLQKSDLKRLEIQLKKEIGDICPLCKSVIK